MKLCAPAPDAGIVDRGIGELIEARFAVDQSDRGGMLCADLRFPSGRTSGRSAVATEANGRSTLSTQFL